MNTLKITKTIMSGIVMAVLFVGCASLTPTPVQLPAGTLDAAAVKSLFVDKTVEAVDDKTHIVSLTYYYPNSLIRQSVKGKTYNGTWKIRKDGRLCEQVKCNDRKCRIIVKEGDVYKKYIVKSDNNHLPIMTYKSFKKGNLVDK